MSININDLENVDFCVVLGTRPEFIKMYTVLDALRNSKYKICVISTGQQRDLVRQTLKDLDIRIDLDLNLMTENQSIPTFVSKAIESLNKVIGELNPKAVIVHGDTATTLAGSLASFFLGIPVFHVESGCRSENLEAPWPEEGIRRMTDSISSLLFAGTEQDFQNIQIQRDQIKYKTGNTGVDTVHKIVNEFQKSKFAEKKGKKILVSIHRRESLEIFLPNILSGLKFASHKYPNLEFNFICHPNPSVIKYSREFLTESRVELLNPLNFKDLIKTLSQTWLCLTDSGGLTLDAVSTGVRVGILRDDFEQPNLLESNHIKLIGRDSNSIPNAIEYFLNQSDEENGTFTTYFGEGNATKSIIKYIDNWIQEQKRSN